MANTRNDDMDRSGNRSTPQGSNQGINPQGNLGNRNTPPQGSTSDPVARDREMNRDRETGSERDRSGFGSTGTGSTGTGSIGTGSTGTGSMGSDRSDRDFDRDRTGGRGPSDESE